MTTPSEHSMQSPTDSIEPLDTITEAQKTQLNEAAEAGAALAAQAAGPPPTGRMIAERINQGAGVVEVSKLMAHAAFGGTLEPYESLGLREYLRYRGPSQADVDDGFADDVALPRQGVPAP